jgi:2-dehydropantoate 2-reductase
MGGVGGYFGGLLAKAYEGSEKSWNYFIARADTKKYGKKRLLIINDANEVKVYPKLVSNDPDVIGKLDFIMCYQDLWYWRELTFNPKCFKKSTIVLPLYNGVDAPKELVRCIPIMKFYKDAYIALW